MSRSLPYNDTGLCHHTLGTCKPCSFYGNSVIITEKRHAVTVEICYKNVEIALFFLQYRCEPTLN